MALGENYNVILPFTTSNAIVPSTIVTGQLTVTGDISAERFIALRNGTTSFPAFGFSGIATSTGMLVIPTTGPTGNIIAFSVNTTIAGGFLVRSFQGSLTPTAALLVGNPITGNFGYVSYRTSATPAKAVFYAADATTVLPVAGYQFRCALINGFSGFVDADGTRGFVFAVDGSPSIFHSVPGTYVATWDISQGGTYFCKPGLGQFATTSIIPSTQRSDAHLTNIASGVTTVFFTLPTTVPGLQYKVSNAHAVANTVVISPQTASDTINVFGLTKAAGASVAANAPFSSITLHCITSTQWLATEIMGTWT